MSPGGPLPPHPLRPPPALTDRFISSRDVTSPVSVHSEDECLWVEVGPQTHEVQDDEGVVASHYVQVKLILYTDIEFNELTCRPKHLGWSKY